MVSLLPSNATPLEKELQKLFPPDLDLTLLRGFKFNEATIPYIFEDLIQEYGLETVRLWITRPDRVLEEGLLFQRLKGTPKAVEMALGWAGLSGISVHESGPGAHFAEFQVGIEGVLPDFALETVIALIDMAKPLRAHLKRVYNDLEDHRYLVLDENDYGDFLCGDSGIFVPVTPGISDENEIQISLGRRYSSAYLGGVGIDVVAGELRNHAQNGENHDIFRLDVGILDENASALQDTHFVHEHDFVSEVLLETVKLQRQSLSHAKSQIVLDDGWALDSENAALEAFEEREIGETFKLDSEESLSQHFWAFQRVEVLERFYEERGADAQYEGDYTSERAAHRTTSASVQLIASAEPALCQRSHVMEALYRGNLFWPSHKPLNRPWTEETVFIERIHSKIDNGGL